LSNRRFRDASPNGSHDRAGGAACGSAVAVPLTAAAAISVSLVASRRLAGDA